METTKPIRRRGWQTLRGWLLAAASFGVLFLAIYYATNEPLLAVVIGLLSVALALFI